MEHYDYQLNIKKNIIKFFEYIHIYILLFIIYFIQNIELSIQCIVGPTE